MSVADESKAVAKRVAAAVATAGWTQHEVGAVLGRAQSQVSKRMSGAVPFRASEVVTLARALGVDVASLLNGEEVAA